MTKISFSSSQRNIHSLQELKQTNGPKEEEMEQSAPINPFLNVGNSIDSACPIAMSIDSPPFRSNTALPKSKATLVVCIITLW